MINNERKIFLPRKFGSPYKIEIAKPSEKVRKTLKKAKEMGVEIPENIANYFSEYGIEV